MAKSISLDELKNKLSIRPPEYIRTGVLPLDLVFQGRGIPTNCYTVLWSQSGFGKSTLLLSLAKSLSQKGQKTVYAMIEDSMSTASDMGVVDDPNVSFLNVRTYVEAEQVFDAFLNSDATLLVLDSITGLSTEEVIKLDEQTGDMQPASDARLSSALEKKYANLLKGTGKAMLIVSQERANFNGGWGGPATTMQGGYSLKFYSGVVIQGLGVRKVLSPETKESIGTVGYLTAPEKNRHAAPGGRSPVQILFGKGQSNIYALLCFMQWKGYYTQGGANFKLSFKGKEESVRGRVALYDWIKSHYDSLEEDFYYNASSYFEALKQGWKPTD